MCVVGVHHPRPETTIEDLLTLVSQFGFEFSLVHDKPSCEQVRTPRVRCVSDASDLRCPIVSLLKDNFALTPGEGA